MMWKKVLANRLLRSLMVFGFVLSLPALMHAQAFPSKPVRFIVPYTPGGASDIQSRLIGQKLSEMWGQPVLIENIPGGLTTIANTMVNKAPPDGHTFMIQTPIIATLDALVKTNPYNFTRDFTPIAFLSSTPYVVTVHPKLGVKTLQELIALLKAKPGAFNYASTIAGGMGHIATELFKFEAGVTMTHIAYRGSGAAIPDVLGGHVPIIFDSVLSVLPYVQSGQLIGLAITTKERSPLLPDVPTVAESGLPGFDVSNWFGILGPPKMSPAVVAKINADIMKVLNDSEVRERLRSQGANIRGTSAEEFSRYIESETAKWTDVIVRAKIHVE